MVSAGKAELGRIVPGRQGGPRRPRRADMPFVLGLAVGLAINLALLMALYFRADPEIPPREPDAIPVELVQQPPAPKPQPQPQPQAQTEPEKPRPDQPKIDTKYMRSGGDAQDEPLGAPETGAPDAEEKPEEAEKQTEQAERDKPEKQAENEDKGAAEKRDEPIGPLPAWARHVTQGYGATRTSRGASASGPRGGGNLYLNKMREKISSVLGRMNVGLPRHPAEFSITVAQNGSVVDVKIVQSSGDEAFDQAGYAAIVRAGPFDPLPSYIDGEYVEITFTFTPQ
ncbi:TonB family protein [Parvibaculum indicum]|uniref:energy transducer TonB n=1 Tax=Parvibaculum indicum TaxID=562969 RepID=UPI0031B5875C